MLLPEPLFFLLIGAVAGFVAAVVAIESYKPDAEHVPTIPSIPWLRRGALGLLKNHRAQDGGSIVEMGSGWGGLAMAIARDWPGARVVGVERSALPYWVSRARLAAAQALGRYKNLRFVRADFFALDLAAHDTAVCYLLPRILGQLPPRLAPGALLISAGFAVPDAPEPLDTWGGNRFQVYAYRMP